MSVAQVAGEEDEEGEKQHEESGVRYLCNLLLFCFEVGHNICLLLD